jgi:hypothetical protein
MRAHDRNVGRNIDPVAALTLWSQNKNGALSIFKASASEDAYAEGEARH